MLTEPEGAAFLSGELAAAALNSTASVAFITGPDGRIEWVNRAFSNVTGWTAEEAIGETPRILQSGLHDSHYYRQLWRTITAGGSFSSRVVNRTRSGDIYIAGQTVTPIPAGSDHPRHFVAIQEDLTREIDQLRVMTDLVYLDQLTGLGNRRRALEELDRLIASKSPFAVLMVDLDDFKSINDKFGHDVGDAVLVAVGSALRSVPEAHAFRLGGDEFLVICGGPSASPLRPLRAAHRIQHAISELLVAPLAYSIGASVGVALFPLHGETAPELLRATDLALYAAKGTWAGLAMYKRELGVRAERSLGLRRDIELAADRGEIRVAFQPILGLDTDRLVGWEALARWHHPRWGEISPTEFIPLAEQVGVLPAVSQVVLESAILQAASTPRLRMAVNVSPRQLEDPGFTARLAATVRRSGMSPGMLDIEVTESHLLQGQTVSETLRLLFELGVGLVVDDFGSGYSRLSYLTDFPFSALKLDCSLTARLVHSERHRWLVEGTIETAHRMGARVIAEGVETPEQLAVLKEMKCDEAQGFLLGEPKVPALDVLRAS